MLRCSPTDRAPASCGARCVWDPHKPDTITVQYVYERIQGCHSNISRRDQVSPWTYYCTHSLYQWLGGLGCVVSACVGSRWTGLDCSGMVRGRLFRVVLGLVWLVRLLLFRFVLGCLVGHGRW